MNRRRVGAFPAVLGGALIVSPGVNYGREFFSVDSCLDAGGSYDYTQYRCDHTSNHPFVSYTNRHRLALPLAIAGAAIGGVGAIMLVRRAATIQVD